MLTLSMIRMQRGMLTPAVILLALGVGFLISAAASHRLTKHWEQNQKPRAPAEPAA
jgi:hypothetical protein